MEKVEEASIPDTMKKADEDINNDEVEATEWSTQDSIYQNQSSEGRITPSGKDKKKAILIGNINEDAKARKEDVSFLWKNFYKLKRILQISIVIYFKTSINLLLIKKYKLVKIQREVQLHQFQAYQIFSKMRDLGISNFVEANSG